MEKKNVILGLIAVGALAAAAVFLSSDKGKKMSKKWRKKGMDTVGQFKDKMSRYAESRV